VSPKRDTAAGRPQPLSEALSRFLERSGLAPKLEAASIIPEWADRVGPEIAAVTEPIRLSEGTLFVGVSTSAWMMELSMMKHHLLRRINAGRGAGRVSSIVFLMLGQETDRPAPVRHC
jgi:predicted nucleic acid-binding Zn ribbon protein